MATTKMNTKLEMKTGKKPFCKICFDTKQPESVYTSHYVRDVPGPNGVVVCPTLLQIECRYCKKKGHTNSKCPILKKKQNRHWNQSTAHISTAPTLSKKPHNNVFQVLEVDSTDDDDNDNSSSELDDEPTTTHTNPTDSTVDKNIKSYILALKKHITATTPEPTKVQYKPETPPGPPPGYYTSKCWADYSDSDDE